jgi:hypothetical protein
MSWRTLDGESWLLAWLDEQGARSNRHVSRILAHASGRENLKARAHEVPFSPVAVRDPSQATLAADVGIDLSAELGCYGCLKSELDSLFQRAGYYFDDFIEGYSQDHQCENDQALTGGGGDLGTE